MRPCASPCLCSYDVRLQKRGRRVYVHVMWKFLEQKVGEVDGE